ncbi:MAG: hypothetical protein Rubg2KO_33690 [Rubricoccaceae bacterium]
MAHSPPKPLTLVRMSLMVASAVAVVLNLVVPTQTDGMFHWVIAGVYLLALTTVGLTFTTPWMRRRAREIVIVVAYLITGADVIENIIGGYPLSPMWVAVVSLGGAVAVGSLAWRTRVLGAYLTVQLSLILSFGLVWWPTETLISVVGGLAAVSVLALVLTHNRMTSEWALRNAIATLREHEAELETALYRSEEASRVKSAILAAMSHEIRTPLTGVIGHSALLAEELDASSNGGDPEGHTDLARAIQRGGERLLRTFDSVLNLARLETEAIDLQLDAVDIGQIIQRTVAPYATASSLSVRVDLPPGPIVVKTDAEALGRAIEHLVHNATTYTEIGGVTVELVETSEAVEIGVIDTGPGIEADLLPTLFEPFRQASEGHDRTHEGVGLGLSLARQLADALGGEITVDSTVGQGSRFALRLPRMAERSEDDELAMTRAY